MKKTKSASSDISVLERRITVSDRELAVMLGVGLTTARKIAEDAGAVCRIGTRKINNVELVKRYMNALAGE